MNRPEVFDAVVVGSGVGGLAAASLLARVGGKRVLVLERHFKPGGFTHTFERRRWRWDVGVHYVGGMGDGEPSRRLFDLASGGALHWTRLPRLFERFVYPGLTLEVPDDEAGYRAALAEKFPGERPAIDRWFRALRAAAGWANRHFLGLALPRPAAALLARPGRAFALRTTAEALDATVREPLLKAVLASQWGDYGLPPSQSAFAVHALIATHYLRGAYYPSGGAGEIARTFLRQVEAAGGECRVNSEVREIRVEEGRVRGVRVVAREGGRASEVEIRAPVVISDAGVAATYGRLLGNAVGPRAAEGTAAAGNSAVTLYLGLRESPAGIGFSGQNTWLYEDADHDRAFAARGELLLGKARFAYLSFPSMKDPTARSHTAEVVAVTDDGGFSRWRDLPWKRRGEEYERLKATVAGALLDLVERHAPGFRDLVAYQELSTPLTVEHFTGHPRGRIYGVPATPERFRDRRHGVRTPVKGLFLAGADATSLGVVGAFMGGVLAAGLALGPAGVARIMAEASRAARPAPARAAHAA